MKSKDKERLTKCRPLLVKGLDLEALLPALVKAKVFSTKEEKTITKDDSKQHRATQMLDKLAKKKTDQYSAFLGALADLQPHLYLTLTDDEWQGDPEDLHASLCDEQTMLQRVRKYLMAEVDGAKIVPCFKESDFLTEAEKHMIMRGLERKERTETLLDVLERKGPEAYDKLVEAISDTYPHVYLALTGQDDLDDDDDDWY